MRYVIEHMSRPDNQEPSVMLSRDKGQRRMVTGTITGNNLHEFELLGEGSLNISIDPDTTLHIRPAVFQR